MVSLILTFLKASLDTYTWSHGKVLAVVQDLVKDQPKVVKQKTNKRKTTAIPFVQEHKASLPDSDQGSKQAPRPTSLRQTSELTSSSGVKVLSGYC